MHLLLTALGSYGDVLPMVGIGATMRRRGWRVQIIVNPYFHAIAEEAGLEPIPLGTADEYRSLMSHPDLWHPRRGMKVVLGLGLVTYLRQLWDLVVGNYREGETIIAAHGLDLASRVLHDRRGARLATVHFAPFAVKTLYDTPRYIGAPTVHRGPRWFRELQFWLADKLVIDPIAGPAVNRLRAEQGLPPVTGIFSGWNNSPQLVLGMWPDWFGAPQPDWPPQMRVAGFPLWDPRSGEGLPADVAEFLDAGEPPLAFAPGSANVQGHEFFATAAEVCRRLGRRGLLLTKYPDQLPPSLPPGVRHVGFVPFSALLPRVAALVHHGGIGTCGQALASGRPQIVMPMAYDQLDNGTRVSRLGVGAVVTREKFESRRVARELEGLLSSPATEKACREIAARCDGPASLEKACDLIAGLGERRGAPPRDDSG